MCDVVSQKHKHLIKATLDYFTDTFGHIAPNLEP